MENGRLYFQSNDNRLYNLDAATGGMLWQTEPQQLFHKFARLSATPTGKERSIGLGLYITKKMVEMMNGRIWAESAGKGKGSIFTVQLPLAEQMAA